MFNRIVILTTILSIIIVTHQNTAVASPDEQACQNAAKQKLQKADFGSDAANKAKPIIIPFALPKVMNVIRSSNRGELISSDDRFYAIKQELEAKNIKWIVKDSDKVSREAVTQIEPLLKSECKTIR